MKYRITIKPDVSQLLIVEADNKNEAVELAGEALLYNDNLKYDIIESMRQDIYENGLDIAEDVITVDPDDAANTWPYVDKDGNYIDEA